MENLEFLILSRLSCRARQRAASMREITSEEIEPIYRVAVQDGKLVLLRLKNDPDTLEPRTRDVFSGEVGPIRFTRDSNNQVSGFLRSTGRIRNFRFMRQAN